MFVFRKILRTYLLNEPLLGFLTSNNNDFGNFENVHFISQALRTLSINSLNGKVTII